MAKPGASHEEIVENIDVGGPSMLRAAAKNYHDVAMVTDPAQYPPFGGRDEGKQRGHDAGTAGPPTLAAAAFARTATYDQAISNYFAGRGDAERWPPLTRSAFRAPLDPSLRRESRTRSAAFYVEPASGTPASPLPRRSTAKNSLTTTCSIWTVPSIWSANLPSRRPWSSSTTTLAGPLSASPWPTHL